jgi:hypothetical protein
MVASPTVDSTQTLVAAPVNINVSMPRVRRTESSAACLAFGGSRLTQASNVWLYFGFVSILANVRFRRAEDPD